ncbi:MAG: META domain-containing protein [Fimbriimonadaceae bacterium]|nr:META domain-containing protein [Fimbriimonadaceae bacterium]
MTLTALCGMAVLMQPAAFVEFSGTVTHRERIALVGPARVVVQLIRPTRTGPEVVAEYSRTTGGRQVPHAFRLSVPRDLAQGSLQVTARIEVSGETRFHLARPAAIRAGRAVDLVLTMGAPRPAFLGRTWTLAAMQGEPVRLEQGSARLGFDARNGQIQGNTSVNGFGGEFRLEGDRLEIDPGPMTMMAGPEPNMIVERRYLDLLLQVTHWREAGGRLQLLRAGKPLLEFRSR